MGKATPKATPTNTSSLDHFYGNIVVDTRLESKIMLIITKNGTKRTKG